MCGWRLRRRRERCNPAADDELFYWFLTIDFVFGVLVVLLILCGFVGGILSSVSICKRAPGV